MEPYGYSIALAESRRHMLSARPDAPVVPDGPPAHGTTSPARRKVAGALRRLADRLDHRSPVSAPG